MWCVQTINFRVIFHASLHSYSTAVVHALRKHTTQVALRVRLELPEETARALIGSGD